MPGVTVTWHLYTPARQLSLNSSPLAVLTAAAAAADQLSLNKPLCDARQWRTCFVCVYVCVCDDLSALTGSQRSNCLWLCKADDTSIITVGGRVCGTRPLPGCLHVPIVGRPRLRPTLCQTSRTDQSDRPVGPTIGTCKRPLSCCVSERLRVSASAWRTEWHPQSDESESEWVSGLWTTLSNQHS